MSALKLCLYMYISGSDRLIDIKYLNDNTIMFNNNNYVFITNWLTLINIKDTYSVQTTTDYHVYI